MNDLLDKKFILPDYCPICGRDVRVTVTETMEENDGTILADTVEVTCVSEPRDWSSDEFEEWQDHHWANPYQDWLPVQIYAKNWVNNNIQAPQNRVFAAIFTEDD